MLDLVSFASRAALAAPPVRGVGIFLEHASRLFSGVDREVVTMFDGSRMSANPSVVDGRRHLFTSRYHDREERAFIKGILRRGDYAVDVGANVGLYTLLFARLAGKGGSVTSIEAEPGNASRLRRNIALNNYRNVTVVERGVSDKFETLKLHLSGTNLGMHSFIADEGRGDVEVQCAPLSSLVTKRARLMKIDVEGFEFRILKQFFADDAPKPEYLMFENWKDFGDGDTFTLCEASGYKRLHRFGANEIMAASTEI